MQRRPAFFCAHLVSHHECQQDRVLTYPACRVQTDGRGAASGFGLAEAALLLRLFLCPLQANGTQKPTTGQTGRALDII